MATPDLKAQAQALTTRPTTLNHFQALFGKYETQIAQSAPKKALSASRAVAICAQYYALWHYIADPIAVDRAATYIEEFADLDDFKSKYNTGINGPANQTLKALYDARACVYLQIPL